MLDISSGLNSTGKVLLAASLKVLRSSWFSILRAMLLTRPDKLNPSHFSITMVSCLIDPTNILLSLISLKY